MPDRIVFACQCWATLYDWLGDVTCDTCNQPTVQINIDALLRIRSAASDVATAYVFNKCIPTTTVHVLVAALEEAAQ